MSKVRVLTVSLMLCCSFFTYGQTQVDLNGKWIVTVKQPTDDKPVEYSIEAEIRQIGTNIIGVFNFDLKRIPVDFQQENMKNNQSQLINFTGTMANGLLRLDYQNQDPQIPQFGSGLLSIKSARHLSGRFLGFGPETREIVSGDMTFDRK